MNDAGFLSYLAFIFLPGLGVGELLHLWNDEDGFTARLAYALGIGLCVDTMVLVVRTAGITNLLRGVDYATIYSVIAFGLVALLVPVSLRRRFSWWRRPNKLDLMFLGVLLIQVTIIILYFQKYPIFPTSTPPDFFFHVSSTKSLIAGSISSVPHGVLYYGIYYQLAPAFLLVGGTAVVTVRWTMGILVVLSTLLFFLAAQRLSGSQGCGVIVALVYVLSGAISLGMVLYSGLYSNFFGVMAALFLLVAFLDAALGPDSRGAMITLGLATVTGYFSHYSTVTILPAILAFPFLILAFQKKKRPRPLVAAGVVIIPGLLGLIAYPQVISRLLFANQAFSPVLGSTGLSAVLSPYPILSYMAVEANSDLGFVVLGAFACVCVWRLWDSRGPALTLPAMWIGTLLVVAPLNSTAWRYAFEALVPFTLMAGLGIFSLLPKSRAGKGRQNTKNFNWKVGALLVLMLTPIVVPSSEGAFVANDAVTQTSLVAQTQGLVNQSISWLGANTPLNASYLSVSDVWFTYSGLMINRNTTYQFESTPSSALQAARGMGAKYIIVTYLTTGPIPPNPGLLPWHTFPTTNSSNLRLIYQNLDVRVYQVVTGQG